MVCIYCGHRTHVTNSRLQKRQNAIWRRRACESCQSIFTTQEQPVLSQGVLVRDLQKKKLQPFSRDTLFISIYEACKHRSRAVVEASALVDTITTLALQTLEEGVLDRAVLTQTAHAVLGRFDDTAAKVYAAYHAVED